MKHGQNLNIQFKYATNYADIRNHVLKIGQNQCEDQFLVFFSKAGTKQSASVFMTAEFLKILESK